jgi:alkanesulfonate monooxygenase SsuD/methylene tetrahydromethanopterin reductase-like flavin-dependent oxidoreductase (luciferase family)
LNRPVQFGYGLISCQRYPGDARSDVDLYREALALAEECERLGYDSVWVTEHHFFDDAYMPSLLPVCAAIAARTERIAIGTGALLAPLYDPLRLAEDAATVDLLSGGRLLLGLGLGWRHEEFEALGSSHRTRHLRLEDVVVVLREAWGDGLVRGQRSAVYDGVAVTPKPARPGGPPIWIAALAEPAVRRAGRIADGYLGTLLTRDLRATATPDARAFDERRAALEREANPEALAERVTWIREELDRGGRAGEPFTFGMMVPTFAWLGADPWRVVRDHFHYMYWKYEDMADARRRTGAPPRPPRLTPEYEQELRAGIVLGTPEAVAERLVEFERSAGVEIHYVARNYWPGLDPGIQREAVAVFAEGVIPLVHAARARS